MRGLDCIKSTWLGIPGNPGAAKQIPEIHGDLGVTQDSQRKPEKSSLLPGRLGERRNLASPGSIQDQKVKKWRWWDLNTSSLKV